MYGQRRALVIGIDYYEHVSRLYGCVNDARRVKDVLTRNANGEVNFQVEIILGNTSNVRTGRTYLMERIRDLFAGDHHVSLLYFAGHGHVDEKTGGYLFAGDSRTGSDGVPLAEVVALANASRIRDKIIILDSCHSGIAGTRIGDPKVAELTLGTTILAASSVEQYASESNGSGVFTDLMLDALEGAAANLVGDVTPGSVYAHIDQSLSTFHQRPVFKAHVKDFVSLRRAEPLIHLSDLRKIAKLFESPDKEIRLDPSFENEHSTKRRITPNPTNVKTLRLLRDFHRLNLVVPVGVEHLYHAAMQSKTCKLTKLGAHYWRLVQADQI